MKTIQVTQTKHLGTSQANRNTFLFFKPKTTTVGLWNKKQQAAWCTPQCQCVPCSSWPSTIPPSTNMPLWRSAPMSQNRTLLFHKCYLGRTTTFPGTLTSREQMCTQLREPSTLSAIYCDFCPKKKSREKSLQNLCFLLPPQLLWGKDLSGKKDTLTWEVKASISKLFLVFFFFVFLLIKLSSISREAWQTILKTGYKQQSEDDGYKAVLNHPQQQHKEPQQADNAFYKGLLLQ